MAPGNRQRSGANLSTFWGFLQTEIRLFVSAALLGEGYSFCFFWVSFISFHENGIATNGKCILPKGCKFGIFTRVRGVQSFSSSRALGKRPHYDRVM